MKQKLIKLGCLVVVALFSLLIYENIKLKNSLFASNEEKINIKKGTFTNRLSMMLENEEGDYVATTAESWPSAGYKFNSKLSKCESGSKVSWDYDNKRVKMEGTSSDKCYIYFDKIVTVDSYCTSGDNLSDCIKTFGNQGYDKSSIYIHNSTLANGAGDNSYRFAGPNEYVNNFVCFGSDAEVCPTDNLYRIIGVFDDKVKLIKYDYATSAQLGTDGEYNPFTYSATTNYTNRGGCLTNINSYCFDTVNNTNTWAISALNTVNLNTNYTNYLNAQNAKWANMITTTTWKVGGNTASNIYEVPMYTTYQNEIASPSATTTNTSKIGLMYVSDYGYAASPIYWAYKGFDTETTDYRAAINANWMYMGILEWTITKRSDNSSIMFAIGSDGNVYYNSINYASAVRPTFYLRASIKYDSGKGTKENPIKLQTLQGYIKSQYTGTQGENGIYYHNGTIKNGTTVIDANDGSYRYAGANPNNYVCFGSDATTCPTDNLYRIIGVFGDKIKVIKYDYATSELLGTDGDYYGDYPYGLENYKGNNSLNIASYYYNYKSDQNINNGIGSNTWSTSLFNKTNLNANFINNISVDWISKIVTTSWQVGGNTYVNIAATAMSTTYQNEIVSPTETITYQAKIGLMYVSDYGYAASPSYWTYLGYSSNDAASDYRATINNNWMYMGLYEWTITRTRDASHNIFRIAESGQIDWYDANIAVAARPCFYLNSNVLYLDGTGEINDPIIIS